MGLVRLSTGAVLQYNDSLTVPASPTVAYPDPDFVLKVGLHSLNQQYAELSVSWRGNAGGAGRGGADSDAINITLAATVDAADNSQLTIVATINNNNQPGVNASDYALLVYPIFLFGRTGTVGVRDCDCGVTACMGSEL